MDNRTLKNAAADALAAAPYDPHRLALLHSGVALAASLLVTLVDFLLTRGIDNTAGLTSIDTRIALTMTQILITMGINLILPFWELGIIRAGICLSRRQKADPPVLLEGFRRFGPALRLMLLKGMLCALATFLCLQLSAMLYLFSPLSVSFMEAAQSVVNAQTVDPAAMEALIPHLYPVYIIFAVLLCLVLVPVLYRLRLADMAVLDGTESALAAMRLSTLSMKGNCLRFFRLDLSFWWYYGLSLLAAALAYGDLLLPPLNASMDTVAFWGFYIASTAAQLVIAWRFAPQVHTTYAAAYDRLRTEPQPIPQPWN